MVSKSLQAAVERSNNRVLDALKKFGAPIKIIDLAARMGEGRPQVSCALRRLQLDKRVTRWGNGYYTLASRPLPDAVPMGATNWETPPPTKRQINQRKEDAKRKISPKRQAEIDEFTKNAAKPAKKKPGPPKRVPHKRVVNGRRKSNETAREFEARLQQEKRDASARPIDRIQRGDFEGFPRAAVADPVYKAAQEAKNTGFSRLLNVLAAIKQEKEMDAIERQALMSSTNEFVEKSNRPKITIPLLPNADEIIEMGEMMAGIDGFMGEQVAVWVKWTKDVMDQVTAVSE